MKIEAFLESTSESLPPEELSVALKSLWYASKSQWEMAHNLAQDIRDCDGSWIHAHLHRQEGDDWNAGYWYKQADKPHSRISLEEERHQIIENLLSRIGP